MQDPQAEGDDPFLDRLARGPVKADHDADESWEDLGLLVGWLMRQPPGKAAQPVTSIFHYWDQPSPPPDVAECMDSWRRAGPPVHAFDFESARDYLRHHYGGEVLAAFDHAHHPSPQSDILRMARLLRDGGLYVDADDQFIGDASMPSFGAGAALMPLAVCRACPKSLEPRRDDPDAHLAWYYLGSAPWFARPRHPFVARCLERAVEAMTRRRQRGELAKIHADVGPGCVSMAALDHVRACLRAGRDPELQVSPGWPFIRQSLPLAYKADDRNWRRDAVLYGPGAPGV